MPDPPPPTYWEQPELNQTATAGANTATRNFKGDYADLLTFANGLTIGGSPFGDLPLRAINITRTVGSPNLATLRLEYGMEESSDTSAAATARAVVWQMKHTQRIVSLMRRTGTSASMPHRGNLEAWRKEPDPSLYDSFQYRNQVGAVLQLSGEEVKVAQKLAAGVEGAMRFYPTIQKTTTYGKGKIADVGQGLAYIDTPGSPWDSITIGGATAVWLKVGDDVTRNADGTQTRVESWMGAKEWDENLYGTANRWTELD
jgi:hypothetical protein